MPAGGLKWIVLLGYGVLLWWLSPWSGNSDMFYEGQSEGGDPVSFWLLTGSVFISWIFAKSITNAANLAASYGLTGGLAYAAWYLSIPVAGVVIYYIRRQYDVESLAEFLTAKYGEIATLTFMIAIFIRLFNEIWSNTIVVGTYFGSKGSGTYYLACGAFVLITLLYSLRGGLRSSVLTDGIQVILMVFFLSLVLGYIVPGNTRELVTAGELSMTGGLDLLLVGLLQSLSYPFHDPVLTDRGFISDRETTLKSFFTAGAIGVATIVIFSLVGVYAYLNGFAIQDDAPPQVAASLGVSVFFMMNVIMLTSAGSTIDSTFSSLARGFGKDLWNFVNETTTGNVSVGRWVMVVMSVLGTLPIFTDVKILQATTISGTMVMGLAPIFLFFWWERPGPLAFHLSFWFGLLMGFVEILGLRVSEYGVPLMISIGSGDYARLLGFNFYGLIGCVSLYVLGALLESRVEFEISPVRTARTLLKS